MSKHRFIVENYGKEIIDENGIEGKKRIEVIFNELLKPKTYCVRCIFRYICTTRKVLLFQQLTERLLVEVLIYLYGYYSQPSIEENNDENLQNDLFNLNEDEKNSLFSLPEGLNYNFLLLYRTLFP